MINLILEQQEHTYRVDLFINEEEDELTNAVQNSCKVESVGIVEPSQSTEHDFLKGVTFNEVSQRYQESLPWIEACPPIASGYSS